ncbi:hypothetical protein ES703_16575 [subsurface metagenome]
MDKITIQSILIHVAIVIVVMMLVFRVDFLEKLITGGK